MEYNYSILKVKPEKSASKNLEIGMFIFTGIKLLLSKMV